MANKKPPESGVIRELPIPRAALTEKGLILAALNGDAQAVALVQRLTAALPEPPFTDPGMAEIAAIITERAATGRQTDVVTLYDALVSRGRIGEETGMAYSNYADFTEILADTVIPTVRVSPDEAAREIVQAAKSRHLMRYGHDFYTVASRNKPGEIGAFLEVVHSALEPFDNLLDDFTGGSRFRLLSLSDLRQQKRAALLDPETRLRVGQLMLIFARENVGKSAYILLRLALLAATGHHVIYVCGEGLPGILSRLDALMAAHDLEPGVVEEYFHVVADVPQFMKPDEVSDLIRQVQELGEPVSLVALDTLATATVGQNENAPEVMSAAIGGMRRIMRELDCGGILVHHTGKDSARGARGHSSLGGSVDISVEVTREEGSDVVVFHSRKARDTDHFAPFAYQLRSIALDEYGDHTAVVAFPSAEVPQACLPAGAPKLAPTLETALTALDSLPGGMRYGAWVHQMVTAHGMKEQTAKNAIGKLTNMKLVGKDESTGIYRRIPREE